MPWWFFGVAGAVLSWGNLFNELGVNRGSVDELESSKEVLDSAYWKDGAVSSDLTLEISAETSFPLPDRSRSVPEADLRLHHAAVVPRFMESSVRARRLKVLKVSECCFRHGDASIASSLSKGKLVAGSLLQKSPAR